MSKHINTENIIKEKFDSREFAFDEGAWAEAEALIAAQNAGGGKKKILWLLGIFLLLGLGTAGIWFGTNRPSNEDTSLAEAQSGIAADENTQNNTSTLEDGSALPASAETAKDNNSIPPTPTAAETSELAEASIIQSSNPTTESSNKVSKTPVATATNTSESKTGTSKLANKGSKLAGAAEAETTVNNNPLAESNIDNTITIGNSNDENLSQSTSAKTNNPEIEEAKDTPQDEDVISSNVNELADNNIINADEEGDTGVMEPGEEEEVEKELEEDEEASPAKKPKQSPPGFNTKNSFSIIGGLGVWDMYSSTLGKPSANGILGPVFGVGYEAAFNKQFAIGVNLLYTSRGALNYRRVFNSNLNYDFGYQKTSVIVEATNLHFASVPLYARYSFTNKHHVIGGFSYTYLIGTYYTEKKVVETPFETRDEGTKKKFAQHPGFNNWDIISFIGYETNLNDRLKLSAQVHFGFNDMTDDSYQTDGEFNNDSEVANAFDRNLGVQLMLRYDLFKH